MKYNCIETLIKAGISREDASALRRISMTLHRWHELECGDGNNTGSWAIVRGRKNGKAFEHDDDGTPFMEHHHYLHGSGQDYVTHRVLADRENGAKKHLAAIMARYPGWQAYIQGDPRGCALYILRPGDLEPGDDVSSLYTRGIAVCK